MSTALVTGGAGFIGAHLCAALLAQGWRVQCLDNLYTGRVASLRGLQGHPNFQFIEADVCELPRLEARTIFNLACPASPVHYQRDPVGTVRTNVLGMLRVLELARETGATVVQASTSEVYGDPTEHPQHEDYWGRVNPIGPRACYDEGKRCAETLCFDFSRQYRVAVKVARIFNTYGPGMHENDGRVVSNFIRQALDGEVLTLYGHGEQTRSFCYVADMVDALLRLSATPADCTGPMNLGNPHETSMRALAQRICALCGVQPEVRYLALPPDDPQQRCPDIALATKLLGWTPVTSLDVGLMRTVEDFRNRRSAIGASC